MMFLAALPRVAGLPVGDLARLAAVAPRVAAAADGEGGLFASRDSATDVARPATHPSEELALPRMITNFPVFALAFLGTVMKVAAPSTKF